MVIFIFLEQKYPFCVNLVQKFKRVSLRRNLVPRLIWICNILSWCSIFYFRPLFASFLNLAFWCYLINLVAVYSQRLEASGFSCFHIIFILLTKLVTKTWKTTYQSKYGKISQQVEKETSTSKETTSSISYGKQFHDVNVVLTIIHTATQLNKTSRNKMTVSKRSS